MLWILRYPAKATFLLAFTIPLSPYVAFSKFAYASYGYLIFSLTDLIICGLVISIFLQVCLQKKSSVKYPLLKINTAVLLVYVCLLFFTGIISPINEFLFQTLYLLRYALYFMIGFYVWEYLPVKDIEKYILILLSGLVINGIYASYDFVNSISTGKAFRFSVIPRESGLWGITLGAEDYCEIGDPINFGMYLVISLVVNILYLSYKTPKPSGIKKKLAIISFFWGFIALHITMTRAAIIPFWTVILYLFIIAEKGYSRKKIILYLSLVSVAGFVIIRCIGINMVNFFTERVYVESAGELTTQEGRFSLTVDILQYMLTNFTQLWGHGIASSRLYVEQLYQSNIIRYRSGSLYNGYVGILWDTGLIGIIVWVFWIKKHFNLLSKVKKQGNDSEWFAISLRVIIIGFLVGMFSTDFYRNFRLVGYFSFLMGLLLKGTYQNCFNTETLSESLSNPKPSPRTVLRP